MKLVDYLRALLSQFVSKKETNFVTNQIQTSYGGIVAIQETQGEIMAWIAPNDGFVYGAFGLKSAKRMQISCEGKEVSLSVSQDGIIASGGVIVGKGQKVDINVPEGSTKYFLHFISMIGAKSMGGGNIHHSLGGVLCLLSSSVHYLKHSLAVRKAGLVTSLCHQTKLLNCLLSQNKFKGIQHHAMGGLLYLRKELERVFVTLGHQISVAHLMAVGVQLLSCSEKVSSLTTNWNQTRQTLEYSSSSPLALSNLSFGGASC